MTALYLLGAKDPEMNRIAEVLDAKKIPYAYATKDDVRVTADNAYEADPVNLGKHDELVCIECEPLTLPTRTSHIDHHREGDPGYGKAPAAFWEASSLGQLYKRLGQTPKHQDMVLAAMDHCFPAALNSECAANGVAAREALNLKISEIAKETGASSSKVRARIATFETRLQNAGNVRIGDEDVKDLRYLNLGDNYSLDHLAAQIAVAKTTKAALLLNRLKNGAERCTLYGTAKPETFRAFFTWANGQGFTMGHYGCPIRGYSGAHKPLESPPTALALG